MGIFFHNIKIELARIVWPSKKDLKRDFPFFLIAFLFATLIVFGLDSIFNLIVLKIIALF